MKDSPKRHTPWFVGVARRRITPSPDIELAGLGYYLNRTGHRVRDDLTVTAFVIQNEAGAAVAFAAMDILYCSEQFVSEVRTRVSRETGIPEHSICLNCSHSHNAPTLSFVRGLGDLAVSYSSFVVEETVAALVEAWAAKQPARLSHGATSVDGITFNRTRESGPRDTNLNVLHAVTIDGRPIAAIFNFHSHLTAHLETDFNAISRDWVGEVIGQIERAVPGLITLYVQGTCGDVILSPTFNSTDRRFEPARIITHAVLEVLMNQSRPVEGDSIYTVTRQIRLPTRPWTPTEISEFREEGVYRLTTRDTTGWLNGIAKAIVTYPNRLPERYDGNVKKAVASVARFAVEWATDALQKPSDPFLTTEVQALRVGDVFFTANSAELFSSLGLRIREAAPTSNLFMLGYSNGCIGYLPDAYDIERKSYAAIQSPKFTGQLPFIPSSGDVFVNSVVETLDGLASTEK